MLINTKKNNIITVIKHMPGHGCATLDSHLSTPKVNLSIKDLKKKIFILLKNKSLLAMTAHVLYKKNLIRKMLLHFLQK